MSESIDNLIEECHLKLAKQYAYMLDQLVYKVLDQLDIPSDDHDLIKTRCKWHQSMVDGAMTLLVDDDKKFTLFPLNYTNEAGEIKISQFYLNHTELEI
jgi:hypothetical protein